MQKTLFSLVSLCTERGENPHSESSPQDAHFSHQSVSRTPPLPVHKHLSLMFFKCVKAGLSIMKIRNGFNQRITGGLLIDTENPQRHMRLHRHVRGIPAPQGTVHQAHIGDPPVVTMLSGEIASPILGGNEHKSLQGLPIYIFERWAVTRAKLSIRAQGP